MIFALASRAMSHELSFNRSMAFEYGEPSPISPGIVRIVANAGALTFKGTNTYLLGMTELAVIDPGPDDRPHRSAILTAAQARPITHILITHAHRDHVDGAAALKAATGAAICGWAATQHPGGGPGITPSGPSSSITTSRPTSGSMTATRSRAGTGALGHPHAGSRAGSSLLRARGPSCCSPAIM